MARPVTDFYSSDHAYFLADGKTLKIVEKFVKDSKPDNTRAALQAFQERYHIRRIVPGSPVTFVPEESADKTFFTPVPLEGGDFSDACFLCADHPDAAALYDELFDIPGLDLEEGSDREIFARRLTGEARVQIGPEGRKELAAQFEKVSGLYVVSTPIVARAAFKAVAGAQVATGTEYTWFQPPGAKQIPYSQVIAMKEHALGNQLRPRQVPL